MKLWTKKQLAARLALLLVATVVGAFLGIVAPHPGDSALESVGRAILFTNAVTILIVFLGWLMDFVFRNWGRG